MTDRRIVVLKYVGLATATLVAGIAVNYLISIAASYLVEKPPQHQYVVDAGFYMLIAEYVILHLAALSLVVLPLSAFFSSRVQLNIYRRLSLFALLASLLLFSPFEYRGLHLIVIFCFSLTLIAFSDISDAGRRFEHIIERS